MEALQFRASLQNPGDRDAILQHPDAIELPPEQLDAGQVFVCEQRGAVVGFAAVLWREDGDTELDGLFVEPGIWGQGIGRALVNHCAALARGRGSGVLHVIGNPHAEGFYRACGFEGSETIRTRFGEGLLLQKNCAA